MQTKQARRIAACIIASTTISLSRITVRVSGNRTVTIPTHGTMTLGRTSDASSSSAVPLAFLLIVESVIGTRCDFFAVRYSVVIDCLCLVKWVSGFIVSCVRRRFSYTRWVIWKNSSGDKDFSVYAIIHTYKYDYMLTHTLTNVQQYLLFFVICCK